MSRRSRRSLGTALLFLLPALVLYVVFVLLPIAQAAFYSLFRWNGLTPLTEFVGRAATSGRCGEPVFLGAVTHNAIIVVLSLAIQIPFALGLAILLNRRFRGRGILRLIFFTPYVIAQVITAIVWSLLLQPDGFAQRFLESSAWVRCTTLGWRSPTRSSGRCS